MTLTSLSKFIGPIVALAGMILLYHGIQRARRMIFPKHRLEIPAGAQNEKVTFLEPGKYQFFLTRVAKIAIFRNSISQKNSDFLIQDLLGNQKITYHPYGLTLWTRSDMKMRTSIPLGEITLEKADTYQVSDLSKQNYEVDDRISIMSYSGGALQILILVWACILGAVLSIGGTIFSIIAWTKGI